MVLSCLMEPLRVVRDRAGIDLRFEVVTPGDRPVTSSSGLRVAPDVPMAGVARPDLCLLIGGDRFREAAAEPDLWRHLRPARTAGLVIAADTGAWLMAAAGLLEGRRATLHWHLLEEFAEVFPAVTVTPDRHVRDGAIWTCGSAATGLDLILAFIRERFGPAAAFEAESMFLHDSARQASDPRFGLGLRGRRSDRLRRVVARMTATLESPPSPAAAICRNAASTACSSANWASRRPAICSPCASPVHATLPATPISASTRSLCAAASPAPRPYRGHSGTGRGVRSGSRTDRPRSGPSCHWRRMSAMGRLRWAGEARARSG